jgi:hypothetical protein
MFNLASINFQAFSLYIFLLVLMLNLQLQPFWNCDQHKKTVSTTIQELFLPFSHETHVVDSILKYYHLILACDDKQDWVAQASIKLISCTKFVQPSPDTEYIFDIYKYCLPWRKFYHHIYFVSEVSIIRESL